MADSGQDVPEGMVYYSPAETHLIPSKHVDQTFQIQVQLPPRKRGETTRFPVVYATDGNATFDMFKGISQIIQSAEPGGLRFILVAIGYPSDMPMAGGLLRARDLTFEGYPQLALKPPPVEGVLVAREGSKNFMGAAEFQQFIGEELVPFIDANYDTIPGDRAYFGHSAGGGFGLNTLFTRTELFKRYIISSPGLIYHGLSGGGVDYDNYDFVPQAAQKFIASGKSLDGITAYMSVGTAEEFEPGLKQWQLTSSFFRTAAILKEAAIPGLDFTTQIFPEEDHGTVWPVAFMHGVRAVFRNRGGVG